MTLPENLIIASGPVIIEGGKVLLNREKKPTPNDGEEFFMFPGGKVDSVDESLEDVCKREIMEEMGLEIEILRPLKTIMTPHIEQKSKTVILVHYLAKRLNEIAPGEEILEWGWYDINNLPENTTPNVKEVIDSYLSEKK
jgi:ADP-ribose pyrophosphatase YjhB (NUDIX family)